MKKGQKETDPGLLEGQYPFWECGSQPQRQPALLSHMHTRQSGQLTICRRAETLFNSKPGPECLLCAHRWVHARPGALAARGRAMGTSSQEAMPLLWHLLPLDSHPQVGQERLWHKGQGFPCRCSPSFCGQKEQLTPGPLRWSLCSRGGAAAPRHSSSLIESNPLHSGAGGRNTTNSPLLPREAVQSGQGWVPVTVLPCSYRGWLGLRNLRAQQGLEMWLRKNDGHVLSWYNLALLHWPLWSSSYWEQLTI